MAMTDRTEQPSLIYCGHCGKGFHKALGFCPFCKTSLSQGPSPHEDLLKDLASSLPRTFHPSAWVVIGALLISFAALVVGVWSLVSHVGTLERLGGVAFIAIALFLLSKIQFKVAVTSDEVRLRRLFFSSLYSLAVIDVPYVEERRWLSQTNKYAGIRLKGGSTVELRVADGEVDPLVAEVEKALLVFRARHPKKDALPSGGVTKYPEAPQMSAEANDEITKLDESLKWRRSRFGNPDKVEITINGYVGEDTTMEVLARFPVSSAQAGMTDNLHCIGTFSPAAPPLVDSIVQWGRKTSLKLGIPEPPLSESYTFRVAENAKLLPAETLGKNLAEAKHRFPDMPVTAVTVSEDQVIRHNSHTISVGVRLGGVRGIELGLGTFDFAYTDEVHLWAERLAVESGVNCRFFQNSD
jgi:hypothetical protein